MTLNVPLTVRVGDRHITRQLKDLSLRKEAVGGVQSITLGLSARLDSMAVSPLDRVYVYDARTAEVVAEGRVADPGRTADADGQTWTMTAFGPAQHASDLIQPLIYVDQSISDGWRRANRLANVSGEIDRTSKPGSSSDSAPECIVCRWPRNSYAPGQAALTMRYERLQQSGQKLARYSLSWDGGRSDSDYRVQIIPLTDGTTGSASLNAALGNTVSAVTGVVVTDWTNGRNTLDVSLLCNNASGTGAQQTDDRCWVAFYYPILRAMLLDQTGADITTGYSADYVLAHEVVTDVLARVLTQFDGANASIATTGTYQIDQLAYPDGVSAAELLDDVMELEPGYYWTTGPSNSSGLYAFAWQQWPTTVRYEATLEDGGDFPVSTQELYNQVTVRWVNRKGSRRTTLRTGSCPILDAQGIIRRASIDVADELGSSNAAVRIGDNFLAEHQYPANAGTLTIARPIRDLSTGRMVEPHEIEPAELIRVRGVESYPDSLNASSSDGQSVFRVWALNYTADSHSAQLELDTYPRTTAAALARLHRRRRRKR
ncbi:MAG: hypothetical protein QM714_00200 [Nocardioides sp.]|uniref:hypothetical protein n=1 Tax=Nocardioides sp. TaxID=35761 RepID=UPI0039E25526